MNKKFMLVIGIMAMMVAEVSHAALCTWTNRTSTGNWDVAANWSNAVIPTAVGDSVVFPVNASHTAPITCRVDNVMYPSGLTCGSVTMVNSANYPASRRKDLMVSGLTWNVGDASSLDTIRIYGMSMYATNSTITVYGATRGLWFYGAPHVQWVAELLDTAVTLNSATGLVLGSTSTFSQYYNNAKVRMVRGSLTATNATRTCANYIGNTYYTNTIYYSSVALLQLEDTPLLADIIQLAAGRLSFNNANASAGSTIMSNLLVGGSGNLKGGIVELLSGDLTINGNVVGNSSAGSGSDPDAVLKLCVSGATVRVKGSVNWNGGAANSSTLYSPSYFDIYQGSLNVFGSMNLGVGYNTAWSYATDPAATYLRIFGGSLVVSNSLNLGSGQYRSPVHLEMSVGSLSVSNLVVGKNSANSVDGNPGYYLQMGGTNTVFGSITLVTTNGNDAVLNIADWETKQFVLQTNATLILKGNGFVKPSVNPNWSPTLLLNSGLDVTQATNLVFLGKTIYDPVATTTNLAFGKDVGATLAGFTNAFAAGTWDFTAVDGSEAVQVVKAGNYSGADSNAVYVSQIIGLTPATAATYLKSDVNIYYNSTRSTALLNTPVDIPGAGWLLPVSAGRLTGTMIWIQ